MKIIAKLKKSIGELDEFEQSEINNLKPAVEVIKEILKGKKYFLSYKKADIRTFAYFKDFGKLTVRDKSLIKGKINNNIYHVIISDTSIEVHLKNFLIKENSND